VVGTHGRHFRAEPAELLTARGRTVTNADPHRYPEAHALSTMADIRINMETLHLEHADAESIPDRLSGWGAHRRAWNQSK